MSHTLGLVPLSMAPFVLRMAGPVYLLGALVLGAAFLFCAVRFSNELSHGRARGLFYASILYLPLLLGLMVFDRL